MRPEVGEQLAGSQVPQLEQSVLAGRRDPATIGTEADAVHAPAVTLYTHARKNELR